MKLRGLIFIRNQKMMEKNKTLFVIVLEDRAIIARTDMLKIQN